ncbi:hypothetical protein O181_030485 [Austropuccinia psidii MF-1]|uniref:Uncharacterized protein n=1 Tax=Austropuccinia psidii MF-1 TaxID=1389203 RepID=A0A9Q3CWB4_9BASI|nr:hypothetical protein [Austropuccinia psidii MF-1]
MFKHSTFDPIPESSKPANEKRVYCENAAGQFLYCSQSTCRVPLPGNPKASMASFVWHDCYFTTTPTSHLSTVWPTSFHIRSGKLIVDDGAAIGADGKRFELKRTELTCPPNNVLNAVRPVCGGCTSAN